MNIKRGLFRLWIVFTIPWTAWFGYQIFYSNNEVKGLLELSGKLLDKLGEYESQYNNSSTSVIERKSIGEWAKLTRENYDNINESIEYNSRINKSSKKLITIPFIFILIYPFAIWIYKGFSSS